MEMEPGSKQDGVVNMTRAKEALSPLLNHPRKTIIEVEGLVIAAALLLLLQLILGSCRRRWHNSFANNVLQVCNGIMFPLIVYTLGMMQSSPIKNSLYPVWAGFLIMASGGTTVVKQHDFYDSYGKKNMQSSVEYLRDAFYAVMFILLLDPATYNWNTARNHPKQFWKLSTASSRCVMFLVAVVFWAKNFESYVLLIAGYRDKGNLLVPQNRTQDAELRTEESGNDRASDSDPQNMKGCNYEVRYGPHRLVTIEQIWDYCFINSAYGKALKDLCLSCALSRRLLKHCYFGRVYPKTGLLNDHDFVFKKLLPPEGDFRRAFRIIEVELSYCYDFFFTKYYYKFVWLGSRVPVIQSLFLLKITLILTVGVLATRKSLVLETPNPIIEVHISEADYIITLLLLSIALIVELVQGAVYLASNWAQVLLACMHVTNCCREPSIFGKVIGCLRRVMISGQLRNKICQRSVILPLLQQIEPVEVSDAVKGAIAISLRLTYANNLTINEEISVRLHKQIFEDYSWALKDLCQLEVILIWHIATEYCALSNYLSDGNRGARTNNRGVAVHLSRYCAYLIGSVPGLLPYNEADTAQLAQEVMEEHMNLFKSCPTIRAAYNEVKKLKGTEEGENDPTTMFQRGVKLGKQLERMHDAGRHWQVLKCFWAETIIHAAASQYTCKQHMQHLENGGEFLTHIWALLFHAGILSLNRNKDQEGQTNPEPGPSFAV